MITELEFETTSAPDAIIIFAAQYSDFLCSVKSKIIDILTTYETYHVANDEFDRTIDLLRSLQENREYLAKRTKAVVSFLPINQPLYALTSFGLVPALIGRKVFVRPPIAAREVVRNLEVALELRKL